MGAHKDNPLPGPLPGEKAPNELSIGARQTLPGRPADKLSDAFNSLKRENGPPLSITKMNEIAAKGWAGKR